MKQKRVEGHRRKRGYEKGKAGGRRKGMNNEGGGRGKKMDGWGRKNDECHG